MRRSFLLLLSLILIVLAALAACDAGDLPPTTGEVAPPGDQTAAPIEEASPTEQATGVPEVLSSPTPNNPFTGDGPWEVTFKTADGIPLQGTLYGHGARGIVLAPMYPGEQAGWRPFAETVAAQGYRALAFDFRGHGLSEGTRSTIDAPADLAAAVAFMRGHDVDPIVVMGAGPGGMAAIRVAAQDDGIAGLVVISSPRSWGGLEVTDDDLAALALPSLWLGTRNDMTQTVEELHDLAGGSDKTLWIYEGSSLPGTYIFEGADGADMERRLLEFVVRVVGS